MNIQIDSETREFIQSKGNGEFVLDLMRAQG